jgi:hypothetical protein
MLGSQIPTDLNLAGELKPYQQVLFKAEIYWSIK